MYLLEIIEISERDKKELFRSLKSFNEFEEMIETIKALDPTEYKCYEAQDITNNCFLKVEMAIAEERKKERLELYNKLKLEFEGNAKQK